MRNLSSSLNSTIMHLVLISYTLICLFPVYLLVGNSFKSRRAIFKQPLLPEANPYCKNTQVQLFAVSLNYAALYTLLLRVNTIYIFSLRNKTFVTVVKGPLKFT